MRREKANIILLQLLVVLAAFLLFALLPERPGIRLFVNSDALYMPSLYLDLFVHRTGLHVWHLNGAPNFFPEMFLFFPLMALLKSTMLTVMVYGVLQMALILFLINKLLSLAKVPISHTGRYLVLLTYLLIPLSAVRNEGHLIPAQLLLAGYHAGFFINSLLAAIVALSYLKNQRGSKLLILGLLVFMAVISDKLFIMGFVAPAILYSLIHLFQKGRKLPI